MCVCVYIYYPLVETEGERERLRCCLFIYISQQKYITFVTSCIVYFSDDVSFFPLFDWICAHMKT